LVESRSKVPRRLGTLPTRLGTKERFRALRLATVGALATVVDLADQLEAAQRLFGDLGPLAPGAFDEEVRRTVEKESQSQSDTIELLEKKARRLALALEEVERQRDEARATVQLLEKMAGQGPSRVTGPLKAGLAPDDPRRVAKMAMIKELLEQNRELRRALALEKGQPEPAPTEAEVAAEAELSADADVNPDDLPWAPPAAEPATPDGEEGEIKVIRDFKSFDPPPLVKS
jgi:hypothetical protein